jgi:hypothetical protein
MVWWGLCLYLLRAWFKMEPGGGVKFHQYKDRDDTVARMEVVATTRLNRTVF